MRPGDLARLARRGVRQLSLLRREPETFLRNMRQVTDPPGFLARLLDTPDIRPLLTQAAPPAAPPTLNVLLPGIGARGASGITGGPNTVLLVGARLAHAGLPVRFVSCDEPISDTRWFWPHLAQLTGLPGPPAHATLQDACTTPLPVGPGDLFLASFWTTAHQAAAAMALTRRTRFCYLIQDFEPGFYPWSARYAMAMATLGLPFHALVNEGTLADFLFESRMGQFADPAFRASCTVFEPAIDRSRFCPPAPIPARRRRVLVYARPTNPRNLLGPAVAALRAAVAHPAFAGEWEFLAIGARGGLPPIPLGHGRVLTEAPWSDLAGYAALLQSSAILLAPMLSPHTGYPVLEMAACGGLSVTNSFATKTPAHLASLSPNIIATDPTAEGFAAGLVTAAGRTAAGRAPLALPATWPEALRGVEQAVLAEMAQGR